MVVVTVRKNTKKLEPELSFKADYGSLTLQKQCGGIESVSKVDRK